MKALFVHSHEFKYDRDNNFYSDGKLTYEMWRDRYLKYFAHLTVLGRGKKLSNEQVNISSGSRVTHKVLPNLSSKKNLVRNKKKVNKMLENEIKNCDVVIARMPSNYAYYAIKIAEKYNKPCVIEVVGNIFQALWNHGNVLGKILAPIQYFKYRKKINKARYTIYVTKEYLQKYFPPNPKSITTNISNVNIIESSSSILENRFQIIKGIDKNSIKIGLIGSYTSRYKGIDTAIKAISLLHDEGIRCTLYIVGDGQNQWLINMAKKFQISEDIIFVGSIPGGQEVLNWLDTMDIYIQPSLTEGLPRALIEAMSRGLPCVASSVGGIPELLHSRVQHKAGDSKDLARKIKCLIENQELMLQESKKNFVKSSEYTRNNLSKKRDKVWEEIWKDIN